MLGERSAIALHSPARVQQYAASREMLCRSSMVCCARVRLVFSADAAVIAGCGPAAALALPERNWRIFAENSKLLARMRQLLANRSYCNRSAGVGAAAASCSAATAQSHARDMILPSR